MMSHKPLNSKLSVFVMTGMWALSFLILLNVSPWFIAIAAILPGVPMMIEVFSPVIYYNESELIVHLMFRTQVIRTIDVMYVGKVSLMPLSPSDRYRLEYLHDRQRVPITFYHKQFTFIGTKKEEDPLHDFIRTVKSKNDYFEYSI